MKRNEFRQGLQRIGWLGFAALLMSVGMLLIPMSSAQADLPPRPSTNTPVAGTGGTNPPGGGWIQLRASNATTQTVMVQWQDSRGVWIDIPAWRGQFDVIENGVGVKTWWVDPAQFGAPNFRWVVFDAKGQLLTPSPVFTLPTEKNQTVVVQVSLTP